VGMAADVALNGDIMRSAYPFCRLSGPANVLVMPTFDAASITTKTLQELIDFIENHQYINVAQLPESFLGISISTPAPTPPPEKAPAIEKVPEEEAAKIVEAHEKSRLAEQDEPAATGPAPAPAPQPKPAVAQYSEEEKQVSQLLADLRWLVVEGYVTEFADGRLFANPPAPESAPKSDASGESEDSDDEESASTEPEAASTEEATAPAEEQKADAPATEEPKAAAPAPTPPAPIVAPASETPEPKPEEPVSEASESESIDEPKKD